VVHVRDYREDSPPAVSDLTRGSPAPDRHDGEARQHQPDDGERALDPEVIAEDHEGHGLDRKAERRLFMEHGVQGGAVGGRPDRAEADREVAREDAYTMPSTNMPRCHIRGTVSATSSASASRW
jgi:hypothetical protein